MNYFRTWGALFILALTTSAWAFTFNFGFNFGGGSSRGLINLEPFLAWSPPSKTFDNTSTNVQRSWLFTLANSGNDVAENIQLSKTGTAFRIYSGSCPSGYFNLSSAKSCTKKVAFLPTVQQSYSGSIKAVWPNRDDVVAALTGTGVSGAGDTTPDAFTFTDETDIAISTAKVSDAITVTGIDAETAISVTGDTGYGYKKNGAACTATSGTVVVNDTVNACVTSSGSNSTSTAATVTIGGVSDTYTVTTMTTISLSDNFNSYSDGSLPTTNWITISGVSQPVVSSQQLKGATGVRAGAYYNTSVAANQYSQATIVTANNGACVAVRIQTGAQSFYKFCSSGGTYQLSKVVAGTITQLGSNYSGDANGNVIKLTASGTSSTLLTPYVNGVPQTTYTDSSSPFTSGYVGVSFYADIAILDTWTGGEL